MKDKLQVAALENGTVIDHIPSELVFQIVDLLGLKNLSSSVTIGYNLVSQKVGRKGIIKVADKFFTDEEISRRTLIDVHSLGCNRVNVSVRNLDTFFSAFDIKEGDKMWRPESERVIIW